MAGEGRGGGGWGLYRHTDRSALHPSIIGPPLSRLLLLLIVVADVVVENCNSSRSEFLINAVTRF